MAKHMQLYDYTFIITICIILYTLFYAWCDTNTKFFGNIGHFQ